MMHTGLSERLAQYSHIDTRRRRPRFKLKYVATVAALLLGVVLSFYPMVTIHPHHVVVIGGGLAGCTAALEALQKGRKVTLIDKAKLGGNSAKATSGMNAAETNWQQQKNIQDSVDLFAQDIMKSGQGLSRFDLAISVAAHSAQGLKFVEKVLGNDLSEVAILGAHSVPRTHRLYTKDDKPVPLGFLVMSAYKKVLDPARWDGMLVVKENTTVVDIELTKERDVPVAKSVIVEASGTRETIPADSVVLASGGYAADVGPKGLVARYNALAGLCQFTTNGGFATGDILKIAQSLNLSTVDLDQIQLHPTGFVDIKDPMAGTKFLCPEVVRGSGALLLNRTGDRFINELERRDTVSQAIFLHGAKPSEWGLSLKDGDDESNAKVALLLLDDTVCKKVGSAIGFYKAKGFIQEFENLAALSKAQGWNHEKVHKLLVDYNLKAKAGASDEFSKTVYPSDFASVIAGQPVYMAYITPSLHYCMGGLKTNAQLQVLTADDTPVVNLFAAGEVMGGLHGKNRLGGNGMMESATFGMLAGRNAAELVRATSRELKPGSSYVLDGVVELLNSDKHVVRIAFKNLYDRVESPAGTKFTVKTESGSAFTMPINKCGMGFVEFNYIETGLPNEWRTKQPRPGTVVSVLSS